MRKGKLSPSKSSKLQNKRTKINTSIPRVSSEEWLSQYNDNPEELSNTPYASVFDFDQNLTYSDQQKENSDGKIIFASKTQENTPNTFIDNSTNRIKIEKTKLKREAAAAKFLDVEMQSVKSGLVDSTSTIIRDKGKSTETMKIRPNIPNPSACPSNIWVRKNTQSKVKSKSFDESNSNTGYDSSYTEHDVLCCRGGKANNHIGNIHYLQIVRQRKERYGQLSKGDKSSFALSIVKEIQSRGGRFLRNHEGKWREVDDDTARKKVSAALRE